MTVGTRTHDGEQKHMCVVWDQNKVGIIRAIERFVVTPKSDTNSIKTGWVGGGGRGEEGKPSSEDDAEEGIANSDK